eukprot:m.114328 g.114328  ORF g.114328 m.114328 type:complete len:195 (+) comp15473_c0_seq4:2430-3014(+)
MAANVWDQQQHSSVELGGLERLALLVDLHSDPSEDDDGCSLLEPIDVSRVKLLQQHMEQVKARSHLQTQVAILTSFSKFQDWFHQELIKHKLGIIVQMSCDLSFIQSRLDVLLTPPPSSQQQVLPMHRDQLRTFLKMVDNMCSLGSTVETLCQAYQQLADTSPHQLRASHRGLLERSQQMLSTAVVLQQLSRRT